MTVLINKGWAVFDDGADQMKVACNQIRGELKMDPRFTHFPGGSFSTDIGKKWWIFKLSGILFDSTTVYDTFMSNITSWQETAAFTFYAYKDGVPTKFKWDGSTTDFTVRINKGGIRGCGFADGGVDFAFIDGLSLEEG